MIVQNCLELKPVIYRIYDLGWIFFFKRKLILRKPMSIKSGILSIRILNPPKDVIHLYVT